jgi:hypothetical protein
MKYRHRQFSIITTDFLAAGMIINLIFWLAPESFIDKFFPVEEIFGGSTQYWREIIIAVNFFMFLLIANFSSLLIEINNKSLRWYFGIGAPFKIIMLNDIKQFSIVRNKWWHGWGIRRIKKGWLYSVSGLDAVQLVLKNGKIIRLGTDEVKKLAKKIDSQLANKPLSGVQPHG